MALLNFDPKPCYLHEVGSKGIRCNFIAITNKEFYQLSEGGVCAGAEKPYLQFFSCFKSLRSVCEKKVGYNRLYV